MAGRAVGTAQDMNRWSKALLAGLTVLTLAGGAACDQGPGGGASEGSPSDRNEKGNDAGRTGVTGEGKGGDTSGKP